MHALFTIHWYGCSGCREKFESSIENDSFLILLILVSQRFTVIKKLTVFRKIGHNIWLCPELEYFLLLAEIFECIICHNTLSSIRLILRHAVDWVENICNYLEKCTVDNYADSYLDIFRTSRIFFFRNWSTRIDYEHLIPLILAFNARFLKLLIIFKDIMKF